MKRLDILVVASLGLAACGPNDGAENNGVQGPTHDPDACSEFVVPTAMGLGWEKLNHRMSTWSLRLDREDRCKADELLVTHIGGDFSTGEGPTADAPDVEFEFLDVTTDPAQVGVARVTADFTIGPEHLVEQTITVDREEHSLRHYPYVAVIVEGIEWITDVEQPADYPDNYEAAHGYTMRALGAGASIADFDADEISLDAWMLFKPGPSPDRPRLNAALEHAVVGGKLDLLVVGASSETVFEASHSYSVEHEAPEPLEDQDLPHASNDTQRVEILEPGESHGFWGFSSFRFDLNYAGCSRVDTCDGDVGENGGEEPGEYLREIYVGIRQESAGDVGGSFLVDGYVSNASRFLANYQNVYDFSADMVWVRSGDVGAGVITEVFETGSASFALP